MKVLIIPINDALDEKWAINHIIEQYQQAPVQIHLVNVQTPLPRHVSRFFNRAHIQDFHREAGMQVLAGSIRMLEEAKIPHQEHVLVGRKVEAIVNFARQYSQSEVIVVSRPATLLSALWPGSYVSQIQRAIASQT